MDHQVRELHVHVRAKPGTENRVRLTAERFSRSVLERTATRLDAEAPDRLVFIRKLSLRWRLNEGQLEDTDTAEQCAEEIFSCIRSTAPLGVEISARDAADDLAVFNDETHWRAAHLLARARNGKGHAWFFKNLEAEGDPLDVLASPHRRPMAWRVLEQLASQDRLIDVIRASPPEKLSVLAQGLLANAKIGHKPRLSPPPSTTPSLVAKLVAVANRLSDDLPHPIVVMTLTAYARTLLGATSQQIALVVNDCLLQRQLKGSPKSAHRTASRKWSGPNPEQLSQSPGGPVDMAVKSPETEERDAHSGASIAVQVGGLFYLLNCALALNMGEILWKACLPEQQVFSHALAALLGEGVINDAAIALFAGCSPDTKEIQISDAQLVEVTAEFLAALTAALPRRGLGAFPETIVGLGLHPKEHLLVARPVGSPFVLFARPAPTPEAACAALEAFLSAWPRSAPAPSASPVIAELDRAGRIRPLYGDLKPMAPLLPQADSAKATALLAQTIGVMCHLLEARAGGAKSATSTEFIERFLRIPAMVRATSEHLTVAIPAEKVDIQLRRAGLDRDPGWVPWLQKRVRFAFEEK